VKRIPLKGPRRRNVPKSSRDPPPMRMATIMTAYAAKRFIGRAHCPSTAATEHPQVSRLVVHLLRHAGSLLGESRKYLPWAFA
jgi:hypothetical protein